MPARSPQAHVLHTHLITRKEENFEELRWKKLYTERVGKWSWWSVATVLTRAHSHLYTGRRKAGTGVNFPHRHLTKSGKSSKAVAYGHSSMMNPSSGTGGGEILAGQPRRLKEKQLDSRGSRGHTLGSSPSPGSRKKPHRTHRAGRRTLCSAAKMSSVLAYTLAAPMA